MVTEDGTHYMVECNPRPTAGCTIATPEEFDTALFNPDGLVVVPAGRKKKIEFAVIRDTLRHPSRARSNRSAAKGATDVRGQARLPAPALHGAHCSTSGRTARNSA